MYKTFIIFLFITLPLSAQQSTSTYYIDVLIDADKNIYFENSKVPLEEVSKTTRNKVDNLKFFEGKGITYRIFADGKLPLGVITDLDRRMHLGFTQPNLPTRRYLLETAEVPQDKTNWIDQLNKLDLQAIEN